MTLEEIHKALQAYYKTHPADPGDFLHIACNALQEAVELEGREPLLFIMGE